MEIIKKFPNDMDARTLVKLMKSPEVKKMSDAEDSVLEVKAWLLFKSEDNSGDKREVLVIETVDGEMFATISEIFKKEFAGLIEYLGDDIGEIKVVSGKSRAGRKFITCSIF